MRVLHAVFSMLIACGSGPKPSPVHLDAGRGSGDDAATGAGPDAGPSADLVPERSQQGPWTIESFPTLLANHVAVTIGPGGDVTMAVAGTTTVTVLTAVSGGYHVDELPGRFDTAPSIARDAAGTVHVTYENPAQRLSYTRIAGADRTTVDLDAQLGLRVLGATVADSPDTGVIVLADTLDLGDYGRALSVYRPEQAWSRLPLLEFPSPEAVRPLDRVDVARTAGGLAILTENDSTVDYYASALASSSSRVVTGFHAAVSLCFEGGEARVVAADNHGTLFYDHLRVFTPTADSWAPTELLEGFDFLSTECAATADTLLVADATTGLIVVRPGAAAHRLPGVGPTQVQPQLSIEGSTVHLVWLGAGGVLLHATAAVAEL